MYNRGSTFFQKVMRYCSALVCVCGGARVSDMSKGGSLLMPVCWKALVGSRASLT